MDDTSESRALELIQEDQEKKMRTKVDSLLLEALDSGKPIDVTPEYWRKKKKQLVSLGKKEKHNIR